MCKKIKHDILKICMENTKEIKEILLVELYLKYLHSNHNSYQLPIILCQSKNYRSIFHLLFLQHPEHQQIDHRWYLPLFQLCPNVQQLYKSYLLEMDHHNKLFFCQIILLFLRLRLLNQDKMNLLFEN